MSFSLCFPLSPLPFSLSPSKPGCWHLPLRRVMVAQRHRWVGRVCVRNSQIPSSHTEQMLMYLRVLSPLRPLQAAGIPSSGHEGLERRRESSQGKEVVPLGLKLPQEGGVCAVVLLLPWDAGWEEFVWNVVNCIFSWGTRALLTSERAIM